MSENQALLPVGVMVGVGGSFEVLSGRIPRAPLWMQRAGFEWLFRLGTEPSRLWKRYLVGNSLFVWRLALQAASHWISGNEAGGTEEAQ